jgi:alkanesulfonate monooxygenase SsuD/methylene tetrahydromethanopterin reductase-like flavin-dependent oxidoreductase (luciferase family)
MKFGLRLALAVPTDLEFILNRAKKADQLGFDSGWLSDHLMWPKPPYECVEAWTTMSAVGATTERLRLGFTMLNPSFRNTAVLAKMAATLDQITHGRLIFSLGAGYLKPEYDGFGVPFLADRDQRAAYVREVAVACKMLWTQANPVSFNGDFISFSDCHFSPAPYTKPHPPIWFGGDSEHTRGAVRDLGNGWVMHLQKAEEHLSGVGDDATWPSKPVAFASIANVAIAKDQALASEAIAQVFSPNPYEKTVESMIEWAIKGTVDQCIARLREIESWGVNYLLLGCADEHTLELLGREVLPIFG